MKGGRLSAGSSGTLWRKSRSRPCPPRYSGCSGCELPLILQGSCCPYRLDCHLCRAPSVASRERWQTLSPEPCLPPWLSSPVLFSLSVVGGKGSAVSGMFTARKPHSLQVACWVLARRALGAAPPFSDHFPQVPALGPGVAPGQWCLGRRGLGCMCSVFCASC